MRLIRTNSGNFYTAEGFHLVNPNTDNNIEYYKAKKKYLDKFIQSNKTKTKITEITSSDVDFYIANLTQLTFEVTDICNLDCAYCAYGELYNDYDKRERNMMSKELAISLIDYLVPFWNSNKNESANKVVYIGFYGGEPTLNMSFIKSIVDYVNNIDCFRTFMFSLTTNGILLHHHIEYFAKNRFNLLISLDGNENNNSYRLDKKRKPVFKRIMKSIDLIRENYPDYFREYVNFHSVIHNKNSVEEACDFINSEFDKVPSLGEINSAGIKPDQIENYLKIFKNTSESLMQSENYIQVEKKLFIKSPTYQTVSTFLHQYSNYVFKDYNSLIDSSKSKKIIPSGTCVPFSKKMFVTVNGKILPCERISHRHKLGNISKNEIKLDSNEIATAFNNYLNMIIEQCELCYNINSCIQCVFHLKNLENKPTCFGFMGESDFLNYCKMQLEFFENNPLAYNEIMEKVLVK